MSFCHIKSVLLVVTLALAGCVTDSQQASEPQPVVAEDVLVKTPGYRTASQQWRPSAATEVTARPIDFALMERFPHLRDFAGTVLLGNARVQYVFYGVPQQEIVEGTRPLVVAAFHHTTEGWQANPVFAGLGFEIESSAKTAIRILGFDITVAERDHKQLTFVVLPVARRSDPIEIKATLKTGDDFAELRVKAPPSKDRKLRLELASQRGSWLKGQYHVSAYDVGGQVALVGRNYLAKPLDRHTWEFPLGEGPESVYWLASGSRGLSQALLWGQGCDEACRASAGPFRVYLGASANAVGWVERSVFLSSQKSWGAMHVMLAKDYPIELYFADPTLRASFVDPSAVADESTEAVTAKPSYELVKAEPTMKLESTAGRVVDFTASESPAEVLLAASEYPEGMKVFSVSQSDTVVSYQDRLHHLQAGKLSFNTISQRPQVFQLSKQGVMMPCFKTPPPLQAVVALKCEAPKTNTDLWLYTPFSLSQSDVLPAVAGTSYLLRETNYGVHIRVWGKPDEALAQKTEDGVLQVGFEDTRALINLARRADPNVAIELGCPTANMSVDDYVGLAQLVRPDLVQLWGCRIGAQHDRWMGAYGRIVAELGQPVALSPAGNRLHMGSYGLQPGFVTSQEAFLKDLAPQAKTLLQQGNVGVGGGTQVTLQDLKVMQKKRIRGAKGARLSRLRLNLNINWHRAPGVAIRKLVLAFDQGSKVMLPVDGAKDGISLESLRTVVQPDERWVRAELLGSTPYSRFVDPAFEEVPLASTGFVKLP